MGRHENTKELFLTIALRMFGERGYEAVKISDVADEIGCTAPALYKHYRNKKELYDAILEMSIKGYDKAMRDMHVDFDDEETRKTVINMSEEDQIESAKNMLLRPLHNQGARDFRKLMTIEQYHSSELAEMYDRRYATGQYERYEQYFKVLIDAGKIKKADPYILAVEYVSPIIVFIGICDRNPEKESFALECIEKHVKEFNRIHRTDK